MKTCVVGEKNNSNGKRTLLHRIMRKFFLLVGTAFKDEFMEVLCYGYNRTAVFANVQLPKGIQGFEDLSPLFWCSPLNRGIIRMDLDEAAYIYKVIRSLNNPTCIEIGRFKGGSTFLMAAAMNGGKLISLDLHVKMMLVREGNQYDAQLRHALEQHGLEKKVTLVTAESKVYDTRGLTVDFVFIYGDHTYEGVKGDFLNWRDVVKAGGHIIFHDACSTRQYATIHAGVKQFVRELESSKCVRRVRGIGSLEHFVKK